jgi:hypothetical protein
MSRIANRATLNRVDGRLKGWRHNGLAFLFAVLLAACGGGEEAGAPPTAPQPSAPSALSYASVVPLSVGIAMAPLAPTVTGLPTSYSVSPLLPAGLAIDPQTGVISGTPLAASANTSHVVTAQNSIGSTNTAISLTVSLPPPSLLTYPSPRSFIVNLEIQGLQPSISGARATYSVSPALPAGLTLNPTTGSITGTPITVSAPTDYFVTATNSAGSTSFALSIAVVIPPPRALSYPSPQTHYLGDAITPITPTVTGVVTQYAVMPALPAGLELDPISGVISGTPAALTSFQTLFLVTARNSSGLTSFALQLNVVVPPPRDLSYPTPHTFTAETAITPLVPTVTGPVTYYSASLPPGLTVDSVNGRISGTPEAPSARADYEVVAMNSTGSTSFTISIMVRMAAPRMLSYQNPQTLDVGVPMVPLRARVVGVVHGYTVSPALPPGLSLHPTTGIITGTPTTALAAATYVITATNSTGSTTFPLTITTVLRPPSGLSYPTPRTFALGVAAIPLKPSVTGIVTTYTVNPALPTGLSLNATTGEISGTPTVLAAVASYVVTATNAAGSTTFALTLTVDNVGVTPARIVRMAAQSTPVVIHLTLQGQTLTGNLYATASDAASVFTSMVSAATTGNGYALSLTLSTTKPAGHYTGTVNINLCSDAGCSTPQNPGSVSVPYDIQILGASSAWPGNNLTTLVRQPGVPDWNMFQGNAAHTGYVPVAPDPNEFSTRWRGPTLNNNTGYNSFAYTLTTNGGQIYLAYDTTLYALREHDAGQVWSRSFAGMQFPSVNPPAVSDGTVYMAAGQQSTTTLQGFNETDGSLVFTSRMSSQWEHYLAPTIGPYGIYTNAGTYGGLYAFDFLGNQAFFGAESQQSEWTPAVDDERIYTYTGALSVYDRNGNVMARIADPSYQNYVYRIGGSPVIGAPGSVFAAAYENAYLNGGGIGNRLVNFDIANQSIAWSVAGVYAKTPAYSAGVVYVGNNNPLRLEARSETNGTLLWSWPPSQPGDIGFSSEVLLTDSMIFVSTNLATYGIDRESHQMVWSYPLSGRLALSRSGVLYIQGAGPVVAINVR